jgi:hypothetical protein
VFEALRADAEWLASAATPEQRAAMAGIDPRTPPMTEWSDDPEVKARRAGGWPNGLRAEDESGRALALASARQETRPQAATMLEPMVPDAMGGGAGLALLPALSPASPRSGRRAPGPQRKERDVSMDPTERQQKIDAEVERGLRPKP